MLVNRSTFTPLGVVVMLAGCSSHEPATGQREQTNNQQPADCYSMVELPKTTSREPRVWADINALNSRGAALVWFWANRCDDAICPETLDAYVWQEGRTTHMQRPSGASDFKPVAMNDRGEVVGWALTEGDDGRYDAIVWRDGVPTKLPGLGGQAYAINAAGTIVGWANAPNGQHHASLWRDGALVEIGSVGMSGTAFDINDSGVVIGIESREFLDDATSNRAFIWDNGDRRFITPGSNAAFALSITINANGDVAGTRLHDPVVDVGELVGEVERPFLWRDGTLREVDALGGLLARMTALNDRGDIAGISETSSGEVHAFVWRGAETQDLGNHNGTLDEGPDVNNSGHAAWWRQRDEERWTPLVWRPGGTVDLPGQSYWSTPIRINDSGVVAAAVAERPTETTVRLNPVVWVPGPCGTDAGVTPQTPDAAQPPDTSLPPEDEPIEGEQNQQ